MTYPNSEHWERERTVGRELLNEEWVGTFEEKENNKYLEIWEEHLQVGMKEKIRK